MELLLIFLTCISIVNFCYLQDNDFILSIIKSYILLFVLIALFTEIASFFNIVTYSVTIFFWLAIILISIFASVFLKKREHHFSLRKKYIYLKGIKRYEYCLILFILIILLITFSIALFSPPNTWDSMTYHMGRVVNWIQNGNIEFYRTSISRQNYSSPLAEYAILNTFLLSGSDIYANLVQWSAFLVSIFVAAKIAAEFEVSRILQFFSGLFVATIPMAILQSSSTQNDLLVGTFCLSFAYFLIKTIKNSSWNNALFCGLALGLAILTKGTSYLYCFAIGVSLGVPALFRIIGWKNRRYFFGLLLLMVIIALTINLGFYVRNYSFYGHPISPETNFLKNKNHSTTAISSVIYRNLALNFVVPKAKSINRNVESLGRYLFGKEFDNPDTTFPGSKFGMGFSLHEDGAGNIIHTVLVVLALVLLVFLRKSKRKYIYSYACSIILSIILFCFFLKWQPWVTRLHTPIFMLSAPFVAVIIADIQFLNKKYFIIFISTILFIYSVPFLLFNYSRPLIQITHPSLYPTSPYTVFGKANRTEKYFANRHYLYEDYNKATDIIVNNRIKNIGLFLGLDDWEYPIWELLKQKGYTGMPRIYHIGVTNKTNELDNKHILPPQFVITTKKMKEYIIDGYKYDLYFDSEYIKVLKIK